MSTREQDSSIASAHPMFYAALAFSAGIALARYAWRPPIWWMIAVCAAAIAVIPLLRKNVRLAFLLALAAMVPLGALAWEWHRGAQPRTPDLSGVDRMEAAVVGRVIRSGLIEQRGDDLAASVDLQTEHVANVRMSVGMRLQIYWRERAAGPKPDLNRIPFALGERLKFTARVRLPRNYGNPGAMDYRGYLQEQGIQVLASVKAEELVTERGESLAGFAGWRERSTRMMLEHILRLRESVPAWTRLSREDTGLLAAMVLGEDALIGRGTKTAFQRSGAYHILVVSGLNVGILAFSAFWLMRRLRLGEGVATLATVLLCAAYVLLTDLGAPIMRAALMLGIYMLARLIYRDRYSLNAIGTAGLALLVWSPQSLFEASFQLTFLSVFALSGIAQPLLERSIVPYRRGLAGIDVSGLDAAIEPRIAQLRLDVRMTAERLALLFGGTATDAGKALAWLCRRGLAMCQLALITMILQAVLAAPMAYYFHRLPLLSTPVNMVVVPAAAALLPVALIATLLSFVSDQMSAVFTAGAAVLLHGITWTVQHAATTRWTDMRVATPGIWLLLLTAVTLMAAAATARLGRTLAIAGISVLAATVVALAWPTSPKFRQQSLEVTVIDVGQGDAILLIAPNGRTLLIDAGGPLGFQRNDSFEIGEDVVSPYLWSRGITRLDAVALSHPHSDHMGGMPAIIANFRPAELWSGAQMDDSVYAPLVLAAKAAGTRIIARREGEHVAFGGGDIEVLAAKPALAAGRNDESLVLLVRYGRDSALLTGDAERATEKRIAPLLSTLSLLKVAHHGSATSTTPQLLKAAHPRFAGISAGHGNVYGHPKAEVISRLIGAQARVLRTDMHGAVTFYLDGNGVTATTFAQSR
jgi:competence protein ComEC